jgi:glutamine cyclotransferase
MSHRGWRLWFISGVLALTVLRVISAQSPVVPPRASRAPIDTYRVVRSYPHDAEAFTQGLEFHDGFLYEGTGLNGRSSIRKVQLDTGDVVQRRAVGAEHFGEGITIWDGRLFELTWQSQVALVYDLRSFEPIRTFSYSGEGWGLTHDANALIMSDGTSALRFLDPTTFRERRRVTVTDGGAQIAELNELEFVNGEVWANIWTTDVIARIDPASGRVKSWIDLRNLLPARERAGDAVLNGIAYDAARDRLFVTGKLWPRLFEIKVVGTGH